MRKRGSSLSLREKKRKGIKVTGGRKGYWWKERVDFLSLEKGINALFYLLQKKKCMSGSSS